MSFEEISALLYIIIHFAEICQRLNIPSTCSIGPASHLIQPYLGVQHVQRAT